MKRLFRACKRRINNARSKRFHKSISKNIEKMEKICFELSQHVAAFNAGADKIIDAVDSGK